MLALKVAGSIFLLVAVLHLVRLILRVKVTIANKEVPLWPSGMAIVITSMLSFWMFWSIKRF
jgi:hypothetical protein